MTAAASAKGPTPEAGNAYRGLAIGLFALTVVFFVASVTFSLLGVDDTGSGASSLSGDVAFLVMLGTFSVSGLFIATRQPRNAIGWIMLAIGLVGMEPLLPYGQFALTRNLPLATYAIAIDQASWAPVVGLAGPMLILLFPNGKPASPPWRWAVWFTAISMALIWLWITFTPGPFQEGGIEGVVNPLGLSFLEPFKETGGILIFTLPIAFVLALISMIGRYRRSSGIERQQLKWLTAAVAIVTFLYSAAVLFSLAENWGGPDTPTWIKILQDGAIISFLLIPIAIGLSVVKYHLYDIDVVINKAVVFGIIAVFITAVYVAIVVGIGALVGKGDEPNTMLTVAATAVVAIAFQPMRKRASTVANRLVFGKPQTQEEVLAAYLPQGVADRLASGTAGDGQREETVATILFSDLRGFTTLAERLSPRALADLIGLHLGAMAEVVQAHRGMIDKFQGDAVMAVFGVAAPQPDHASAAVHCALAMQERQTELNHELDSRAEQLLQMGVGLNTGEVVAGTIGGGGRLEFTVVGDAVNIAQRLQSEAAGGEILAGADTIAAAGPHIEAEPAGLMQVKGREAPVDAYRVMGSRTNLTTSVPA